MNAVTEFSFGIKAGKPITAYEMLVEQIADENMEPRYGYLDAHDIRALTDDEIMTICKAHGDDVLDALDATALEIAAAVRDPVSRARLAFKLEEACRTVLLLDLQTECADRDQESWEEGR